MKRRICFAGGCFWGMEALYRRLPGVVDVTAGYANGDEASHANYDDVCTGLTGFREAVRVEYGITAAATGVMLLVQVVDGLVGIYLKKPFRTAGPFLMASIHGACLALLCLPHR